MLARRENPSKPRRVARSSKLSAQAKATPDAKDGGASSSDMKRIGFNCLYTNATSLNPDKIRELTVRSCEMPKLDFIFITETWFSDTSLCTIPYFTLFRKDRETHAGGVAVYVLQGIVISEATHLELSALRAEHLWL